MTMKNQYFLPAIIILLGAAIGGAIFLSGRSNLQNNADSPQQKTVVRPYDPKVDHILGNPQAQIKVIEYGDLECPYCKQFQTTMNQIMEYYGESGRVAWVYRSFPLAQVHSKAPKEAEASECAADQGGDPAFFRFIDKVYEVTPSSNGLDLAQLPLIAQQIGLNAEAFTQCISSGKYAKKVEDSYNEAIALGARGTPYTFIMVDTDAVPLEGAQPYNEIRAVIDTILLQLSQTSPGTTVAQ